MPDRTDHVPPAPAVSRLEWVALAVVVAVGLVMRTASSDARVVEHYDEGVYASNLYSDASGYAYPDRHLYAPPLWPAVIETAILSIGPSAACWPSIVAGTLLVVAIWALGREWFDIATGLTAALLVAVDPILVTYSQTALVDTPMTLWLAAALWAGRRGIAGDRKAVAAAGIAAGIAWVTKYNGWLAVAMLASAAVVWAGVERWWFGGRVEERAVAVRVAVAAAIAGTVWVPVLLTLPNGYGPVAANHSRYFVGIGGWLTSASQQAGNATVLGAGVGSMLGLLATAVWLLLKAPGVWRIASLGGVAIVGGLAVAGVVWPAWIAVVVSQIAAAFLLWRLLSGDVPTSQQRLGGWLLLAWFHSLHLAVPLYTPYPRLLVAIVPATCLVLAQALQRVARADRRLRLKPVELAVAAVIVAAIAAVTLAMSAQTGPPPMWQSRRGAEQVAAFVQTLLRSQRLDGRQGFGVYVLGEPSVFFHLSRLAEQRRAVPMLPQPAGNLSVLEGGDSRIVPILVVGPHAAELIPESESRLTPLGTIAVDASPVVGLNEASPATVADAAVRMEYRVYRIDPDAND